VSSARVSVSTSLQLSRSDEQPESGSDNAIFTYIIALDTDIFIGNIDRGRLLHFESAAAGPVFRDRRRQRTAVCFVVVVVAVCLLLLTLSDKFQKRKERYEPLAATEGSNYNNNTEIVVVVTVARRRCFRSSSFHNIFNFIHNTFNYYSSTTLAVARVR